MKAYQLFAPGDLRYTDIEAPEIPEHWCLIKVRAAGICSSDIPRIFTKGTYHFPTIPGHEFSGEVVKVADNNDKKWIGKRVGVYPLIPCGECEPCKQHHYEMCENYDYIGSRRDGAFAEYVVAPIWNLIEIPDSVAFQDAAMLEPLSVALHAAKKGNIKRDDTVCIVGTGMIGFAVAQWAKVLGASRVDVLGRTLEKKNLADKIDSIHYLCENQISELNMQYNVVYEAVGSPSSVDQAIQIVKPGGNLVLLGNPSGDINLKQNTYWRILRKQLNIVGTWNSSYESNEGCDWEEAIKAISEKKLIVSPLITHVFQQEFLKDGLNIMREHKEMYCKVMTVWNENH